jgi:hypothetical protein
MSSKRYVFGWTDPRMPNFDQPDYYVKPSYGKCYIYNKDGVRVTERITKQQAEAYMKLLKEEK